MSRVIVIPDGGLDEETRNHLRNCFEGMVPGSESCRWCGGLHQRECPRIKKITYHPTDQTQVREVEFWADGEWDKSLIIFPEDVIDGS